MHLAKKDRSQLDLSFCCGRECPPEDFIHQSAFLWFEAQVTTDLDGKKSFFNLETKRTSHNLGEDIGTGQRISFDTSLAK